MMQDAREELSKYDFNLVQKQVKSMTKAAMDPDRSQYQKVLMIQDDKAALKNYLGEKDENEGAPVQVEQDAVSEEVYDKDIVKEAYNDYWEDLSQAKGQGMGKRRGSQPPSRGNVTSRGSARQGSLLPDINQRRGSMADETMYEASYFGGKSKPKKQNLVDEEETADTKKKGKGVD